MKRTMMLTVRTSLACAPALRAGAVTDWSLIAQNSIVVVGKKFPGEAVVELFPDQQVDLDAAYAASLAGIIDGPPKVDGVAVGEQVGTGFLDLPAIGGLNATVPYVQPSPAPGVYEPTATTPPLGTKLPLVVPLALETASQFRPDGPLPLYSREYAADFMEVKKLGFKDSKARTEEQTRIALFWTDHDLPQWNRNLVRLAAHRGLSPVQTSRMLAMAPVAGSDAMIACFDAKYHYWSWRPLHAIQRAHTDGNPQTRPNPAWEPLRTTPNHPEYPSAHACHTTAIATALERFFGTSAVSLSIDSLATEETRYYDRLEDVVQEVNRAPGLGRIPLPELGPGRKQARTQGRTLRDALLLPAAGLRAGENEDALTLKSNPAAGRARGRPGPLAAQEARHP
jgi:hypothetical protein